MPQTNSNNRITAVVALPLRENLAPLLPYMTSAGRDYLGATGQEDQVLNRVTAENMPFLNS
jgi:hypothetical protein